MKDGQYIVYFIKNIDASVVWAFLYVTFLEDWAYNADILDNNLGILLETFTEIVSSTRFITLL